MPRSIPLLCALATAGCTSSRAAHRPLSAATVAEVNDEVSGKDAEIVVEGEARPRQASQVVVEPGRTNFVELASGSPQRRASVPTAALRSISVPNRSLGAVGGLLAGLLSGALAGGLLGAGEVQGEWQRYVVFVLGGMGALAGAVVGTIAGAVIGGRTSIDFDDGAPCVAAAVKSGAQIFSQPDPAGEVAVTLRRDTPACAQLAMPEDRRLGHSLEWFGLVPVKLSDGTMGFVKRSELSR